MKNLLNKLLNAISYDTRRQKALKIFSEKMTKYLSMDEVEFEMEFVNAHTRYKHQKLKLIVIFVLGVLVLLPIFWKIAFYFIANYSTLSTYRSTPRKIVFTVIVDIMLVITFYFAVIIFILVNDIHSLLKDKIFMDEMKKKRKLNSIVDNLPYKKEGK